MSQSVRPALLAVLLAPLVFTACGGEGKPRKLPANEAEAAVHEYWRSVVPARGDTGPRSKAPDWQMHFTTWLPSEWPPTPQTVWSRYAYGLDVSHDGSCDVAAPIVRIERRTGEAKEVTLIPMATRLKVVGVHPVRPTPGWHYTLEDEKRVLAQALALTAAPPPEARGTLGLVSYYQSWRLSHAVIAGHVEARHRAFFAWLEKQP
jgi:hypothetical protein